MPLNDTREGRNIARLFDPGRWQEGLDRLCAAMAAADETPGTVESCPSCSAGNDGGGFPCDCPVACGARYCQHPTETKES